MRLGATCPVLYFFRWLMAETPPRAWGRRVCRLTVPQWRGNTPTGVGKTLTGRGIVCFSEKHPHGRGEDQTHARLRLRKQETPPRAWGRPPCKGSSSPSLRNTPTGVGKTGPLAMSGGSNRKHPHGRGEDSLKPVRVRFKAETPPRAWGRPSLKPQAHAGEGNTPTGVGKTGGPPGRPAPRRKHPHGRGEDL